MADTRELYIKTKVEDMIVYGNICLKQFPKHERYALASEIRLCMYRILGIVIETNHKHYKKTTLTELDIEVDKLRSYLRLSANPELKYLSVDKYGNWAAMVDLGYMTLNVASSAVGIGTTRLTLAFSI